MLEFPRVRGSRLWDSRGTRNGLELDCPVSRSTSRPMDSMWWFLDHAFDHIDDDMTNQIWGYNVGIYISFVYLLLALLNLSFLACFY